MTVREKSGGQQANTLLPQLPLMELYYYSDQNIHILYTRDMEKNKHGQELIIFTQILNLRTSDMFTLTVQTRWTQVN